MTNFPQKTFKLLEYQPDPAKGKLVRKIPMRMEFIDELGSIWWHNPTPFKTWHYIGAAIMNS